MRISKFSLLGLAMCGVLLLGAEARAVPISYTTIGSFVGGTGPQNDDTYTNGPVTIQYRPNDTTNYDLPFGGSTNADFGSFVVTTSGAVDTPVTASFTLTILQVLPSVGTLDYFGTLSGTLRIGASGAFVTFAQPLVRSIGLVVYELVERDQGIPGNVALVPATINPANPGGPLLPGVTSVEGRITLVPEPSAIVLMGLGAIAPVTLMLRRRKTQATA